MPRQLRDKGGIASVTPRKKYGLGSTFQKYKDKALNRTRKLIPNELADVAVSSCTVCCTLISRLWTSRSRYNERYR
jgi:hypothetical protein